MANEVIDLIRRFEPILYLHPDEKFVPCDAKRYLEHCALWRLDTPLDGKESIGGKGKPFPRQPMIQHGHIATTVAEAGPKDTYLGTSVGGKQTYLVHGFNGQQRFLELGGWKDNAGVTATSQNRYANLEEVKRLYTTNAEPALRNSRFWYHAEFFDTANLRQMLVDDWRQITPAFSDLFFDLESRSPALLCYYFFFPAHEEPLVGNCVNAGEQAEAFGSFAGEWTCMSLLLERAKPTDAYQPSWIGLTGRYNENKLQGHYNLLSGGMTVSRWRSAAGAVLPEMIIDHPKLYVSLGTHSFYLHPGTYTGNFYSGLSKPLDCGKYDGPYDTPPLPSPENKNDLEAAGIIVAKMVAGGIFGSKILGLGAAGIAAGFVWGLLESHHFASFSAEPGSIEDTDAKPDITPEPNLATVIYPKSFAAPPPDAGDEAHPWAADENVTVAGRRYDFVVNRDKQIWWASLNDNYGFRGGWGPFVANDPEQRRRGMAFPQFWKLFFVGMLKELSR